LEKSDTVAIMIHPGPTFDPGSDRSICANKGIVALEANNSGGSQVVWLTNGSGTFSDSTVSSTVYSFSTNDIASGGVILNVKLSDMAGLCKVEKKHFKLAITPAPIVNAGSDLNICSNALSIAVNGGVTKSPSSKGLWTALPTASGTFSSSNSNTSSSLTDFYLPSNADVASQKVALLLTADDNGNCNSVSDTLVIRFTPAPTVEAGSDQQVCGDTAFAPISAGLTVVGGGTWSSNGLGTILDPGSISTGYAPSDTERVKGATVKLVFTSNAQGTCRSVRDSLNVSISARPLVNKGLDVTACGDTSSIALEGSVTNASGGIWNIVSGFGHFQSNSGSSTTLLKDKYIPSASDLTTGVVTLMVSTTGTLAQCKPVTDLKVIKLTPIPQIEAGSDAQVCANNRSITLSGALKNNAATGGTWLSSGTGKFVPTKDTLVTTYIPSSLDSSAGKVKLILTSTGNGNCKPVLDTLNVVMTPSPVVTVSSDMSPCADSSQLAVTGTFTQASGANWTTSGIGSFANSSSNSTSYFLKGQSGSIILTFKTDSGYCRPVSGKITLNVSPLPLVNAGTDTIACADVVSIPLKGTINSVVTATKWSVADGSSISSPTSLSITYVPNQSQRNAGAIAFQLESTAQGKCKPVSDVKLVTLQRYPNVAVNAGLPQSMCYDAAFTTLNSSLYYVQKASWASLTSPVANQGSFIDAKVHITSDSTFAKNEYAPSAFERGNGKDTSQFFLRLTGTSTVGQCIKTVTSDVKIFVIPLPQITLFGKDSMGVCADKDTVSAHAEARVGGVLVSGFWTSTGTGIFEPNYLSSDAHYRLSENDRKTPSVTLVYHAYGGGCDTVSTTKVLSLVPALPTVDAGPDQKVCKNNLILTLDGKVTTAPKYGWSVVPTGGSFTPDSNSLQTVFFPTPLMSQNGAIKLRLRSHGPAACKDVTDDLFVTFTDIPKVNIAPDSIEICADMDTLLVSGNLENATGGIWTSNGTGRFSPSANGLSAQYLPSESDKIKGKVRLKLTSTGNGNCLAVSDSVLLRIRPRPVVTDTAYGVCINADSISLKATSTTDAGFWSTNGTGSFSPSVHLLKPSYYPSFEDRAKGQWNITFTSSDNELCQAVSKTISVQLQSLPLADAGHDQMICVNTSTTIAAVAYPDIVTYSWTKIAPTVGSPQDSFIVNSGKLTTTSTFGLKVVDNKGCQNTDTMVVNVIPRPIVNIPLTSYCAYLDSTIYSQVSQVNPIFGTYQWYTNHLLQFGQDQSSTKITQSGEYTIVFDIGNCSTSDSTNILPLPTLNGINKFVCENAGVTLNVTSSPVVNYTWRKGSLTSTPFSTTVIPVAADSKVTDTTTYFVTAKDAHNCLNVDSIIVFTIPTPIFSLHDSSLCAGSPLVLDAQPMNVKGDSTRFFYLWQTGETTSYKDVTKSSSITSTDSSIYSVTVKIGNGTGSCDGTSKAKVVYFPLPLFTMPDSRIFCGDQKDPNAGNSPVLDPGIAAAHYLWNTGDTTRTIVVKTEGLYFVKVTNSHNCSASDSTKMTEKCQPHVYIPTAFSPNGDNNNDYFVVFGNKFIKNFRLRIFNRWGEVIFNVEDPEGINVFNETDGSYSWDGNYRGKPMPVGIYPFLVTYEGKDEDFKGPYKQEGSVMIIR
jgi:gliding motility-associated-like protein